jgi:hypothetical protein
MVTTKWTAVYRSRLHTCNSMWYRRVAIGVHPQGPTRSSSSLLSIGLFLVHSHACFLSFLLLVSRSYPRLSEGTLLFPGRWAVMTEDGAFRNGRRQVAQLVLKPLCFLLLKRSVLYFELVPQTQTKCPNCVYLPAKGSVSRKFW